MKNSQEGNRKREVVNEARNENPKRAARDQMLLEVNQTIPCGPPPSSSTVSAQKTLIPSQHVFLDDSTDLSLEGATLGYRYKHAAFFRKKIDFLDWTVGLHPGFLRKPLQPPDHLKCLVNSVIAFLKCINQNCTFFSKARDGQKSGLSAAIPHAPATQRPIVTTCFALGPRQPPRMLLNTVLSTVIIIGFGLA